MRQLETVKEIKLSHLEDSVDSVAADLEGSVAVASEDSVAVAVAAASEDLVLHLVTSVKLHSK